MVEKEKYNQEAVLTSTSAQSEVGSTEMPTAKGKNKDRIQRSYFLDRDVEKALRRMALEEEKNLTETINNVLRKGLEEYLK